MTYAVTIDVPAPTELYDAFHAALIEHTGGHVDGLLAHVAWPTPTGFRIVQVWTSKEVRDRAGEEVIAQVRSALAASVPDRFGPMPEERVEELDVVGLVIPSAGLAV
ncbi:hypothetical protein [Nonomuraea sp. 10N515B]|uniref:hypothetical protein n=1 Tax=Nonomuraea sp. 10N515B TaxID=3457422 RepID=UPI003FCD74CD